MYTAQLRLLTYGILLSTLALPNAAFAITGCSTASLRGIFDAQLSNLGLQSALRAANSTATGPTAQANGLAANPNSLSGSQLGMGRYYLDGTGNVVGLSTGARAYNIAIGKYTVNPDCSGNLTLNSGPTYDLVLVNGGRSAVFVQTDKSGGGNLGSLTRSGSCATVNPGASYAFSLSGATSDADNSLSPLSTVGTIEIRANSTFVLRQTVFTNGGVQRDTAAGTYTVGADCSLGLKFNATGNSASFVAPTGLNALIVDHSEGVVTVQTGKDNMMSGSLIAQ